MDDATIKSKIGRTWDDEAGYYDTHVSHGIQTDEEKGLWKAAFSSVLPGDRDLRVLDVGCGTGAMGLVLAEMGHDVTGIDLSKGMMQVGEEKAAKQNLSMAFQVGDAEDPPFEPGSFDVVVNRHLLWTLPHPDTALANWYRVLKPGGMVMVVDGVWDDGRFGTRVKRRISDTLAGLLDPHPHGEKGYDPGVREVLPNRGGVPEDAARRYLADAGFTRIAALNLMNIRENQRRRLPWYRKIVASTSYYLISGRKVE
ncbi:MAG: methyltransferase domain-containing protein [Methanofollis sp.]|uniref:class I SAM-dependent methyltransferase n=1 Tax=Methanofollis sp. TaxID=2052835 RepID=UPI0026144374|nr:class I SAM-dependent methyltransferase [Methanofollis sp.]MDD4254872.1 methyltransferase domain-containing protein [Methanofollis sp.]